MKLVIDANIWVKMFGAEEGYVEKLDTIYGQIKSGSIEVIVPGFLLIELLNILVKKKSLTIRESTMFLRKLDLLKLKWVDFENQDSKKLGELMTRWRLTSYDSLYLLVAKENNCKLLTEDKELLQIKNHCISLKEFEI